MFLPFPDMEKPLYLIGFVLDVDEHADIFLDAQARRDIDVVIRSGI